MHRNPFIFGEISELCVFPTGEQRYMEKTYEIRIVAIICSQKCFWHRLHILLEDLMKMER